MKGNRKENSIARTRGLFQESRKIYTFAIAFLLLASAIGFAQQSHPLSEITPRDVDLNMNDFNIRGVTTLFTNTIFNKAEGTTRLISLLETSSNLFGVTLGSGGLSCSSCIDSSDIADLTIQGGDIANDAIALGTKTTGGYAGSSTEGGDATRALDLSCSGCVTLGSETSGSYDSNPNDDLTTGTSFGGDVSGAYNNLQLGSGVVGNSELSTINCGSGEALQRIGGGTSTCTSTGVSGGDANYIARWTSATSLSTSNIFQDGSSRIGIGTTTPGFRLHAFTNTGTFGAIKGESTSSSDGVFGITSSGAGVRGESSTGTGVSGKSTNGGTGVSGFSNSGGGGVYGEGSSYGIKGFSRGTAAIWATTDDDNYAVYAQNTLDNANSWGIYCEISGSGRCGGNAGWSNIGSSVRWKKDITTIDNALDKLEQLRGVYFYYKNESRGDPDRRQIGVIAEEVGQVIPEVVTYEADGRYVSSIQYEKLTPLLIEAVKEQQKTIENQQQDIENLKKEIESLKLRKA